MPRSKIHIYKHRLGGLVSVRGGWEPHVDGCEYDVPRAVQQGSLLWGRGHRNVSLGVSLSLLHGAPSALQRPRHRRRSYTLQFSDLLQFRPLHVTPVFSVQSRLLPATVGDRGPLLTGLRW